jgi:hypothetical protein
MVRRGFVSTAERGSSEQAVKQMEAEVARANALILRAETGELAARNRVENLQESTRSPPGANNPGN